MSPRTRPQTTKRRRHLRKERERKVARSARDRALALREEELERLRIQRELEQRTEKRGVVRSIGRGLRKALRALGGSIPGVRRKGRKGGDR